MKTVKECRVVISDLISEAVPETDDARREGLLTLADGWIDLIGRRETSPQANLPEKTET